METTLRDKGYVEVASQREAAPVKLYYERHGDGPEKVLLIMGLSTACHAWENQVQYLANSGKYTVLIFDNRGVGNSDAPWGVYSTSQMATDAMDLLDHFQWSQVHVVGISMGGMIALELVYQNPKRFRSLTLTSTTARRNIPTWKALTTLSKITLFVKTPEAKVNSAIGLLYPDDWLDKKPDNPESSFATNREMATTNFLARAKRTRVQPIQGNLGQTAACLTHCVSDDRLREIKRAGLPILVVTGTWDNLVRPESSYHMKDVLEARFELFQGSGHAIPEEQPDRYNRLLDEHFTAAAATSTTN
ncbi:Alpha/Beta hydrolase protein [Radiomyces spectabilis]|uniref:Alpha/Beta hydrolase protein n=1 Tax=Radiomyces spectabilis TaxID=64574 RepID=UPI0022211148|nr:Alpha/Beta hydrolase protein [Radiomyces spectabilis]KAI8391024.1 Alpha/Beta hydrolase protein [Radiomyces spectabilis]